MTLHFILAQISQLSSLSLLQQELGLNHQPLNASPPAALHSAPCYLDFFVTLLEYMTKTTLRICVSNVLATLAQCEALLWTFFFLWGTLSSHFFCVCVDKFFLSELSSLIQAGTLMEMLPGLLWEETGDRPPSRYWATAKPRSQWRSTKTGKSLSQPHSPCSTDEHAQFTHVWTTNFQIQGGKKVKKKCSR